MTFAFRTSKLPYYLPALALALALSQKPACATPEAPSSPAPEKTASLPPAEVLHWLTSGGESAAINVLKDKLQTKGIGWKDVAIAGGGGDQAMTALRARVISGKPPTAAQLIGFTAREWAAANLVGNITSLAEEQKWKDVIPPQLFEFTTYKNEWFNVPMTIHTINS